MFYSGSILKMKTKLKTPVEYELPIGDQTVQMNQLIGTHISFQWTNKIICIRCKRKINKSFAQGYCFPCFRNSPETSECILRPELCEAHKGKSRDMSWSEANCLQPHFVYLAISSGVKVGVTRSSQIPTRWIDQGASFAIILARTPNRSSAGLIEVALKEFISDRTAWQRMLKNQITKNINLFIEKEKLIKKMNPIFHRYIYENQEEKITEIVYPVMEYPNKIKSIGFDKIKTIEGKLIGIKGQYLIFDDNTVLNIRKHNGYVLRIKT